MYNFVIFGSNWDLYKISYKEICELGNAVYIPTPYKFTSPVLKFLYRLHFSPRIKRWFNLPFKGVWNSRYYADEFSDNKPRCFVFFPKWCEFESYGLLKHLRGRYPGSKMICFFQDLIVLEKDLDIEHIKDVFDIVISFDHAECQRYDLEYHHLVYSNYPVEKSPCIPDSDVYFLGKAKSRLGEIIKTYEHLRSNNLKCDFHLVGVDKGDQVYPDEIHYIEHMSYVENLQHVVASKCILEVMQQKGTGYTQRMCEAIAYDKKLLTNNRGIKKAPFYNPKYISVFSNPSDMDAALLTNNSDDVVDYDFKNQLSPKHLLSFIEEKLLEK
jgi:hypothetical protein